MRLGLVLLLTFTVREIVCIGVEHQLGSDGFAGEADRLDHASLLHPPESQQGRGAGRGGPALRPAARRAGLLRCGLA